MEDINANIGCRIGCVAKCMRHRLGVITHRNNDGTYWYGIGLDGRSWESTKPTFIANNINDYIAGLNK